MTNYEKFQNMSIVEMASELERIADYICEYFSCEDCPFNRICTAPRIVKWLESEVDE